MLNFPEIGHSGDGKQHRYPPDCGVGGGGLGVECTIDDAFQMTSRNQDRIDDKTKLGSCSHRLVLECFDPLRYQNLRHNCQDKSLLPHKISTIFYSYLFHDYLLFYITVHHFISSDDHVVIASNSSYQTTSTNVPVTIWTFNTSADHRIRVEFLHFDIRRGYSFLDIGDGMTADGRWN